MTALARLFDDRLLMAALAVSATVHATALAIRFVDPSALRVGASDPPLEIILVNAKSDTRPTKAQALAQANLDGGGPNDTGRRSSPLPNTFEMRDGTTIDSPRRSVQQLEEEQRLLLAKIARGETAIPRPQPERRPDSATTGAVEATADRIARMHAEIAKQISDYQARPRKHHFMPSASEYRYARYVEDWRGRVESIGNEHYPDEARGRIYGSLRMTVAIRRDGTLAEAVIERSSGSPVLDRAALRIVKLASPYAPFPPDIARDTDILEITRTWMFTNDQFATATAGATGEKK